ncbi:MAG: hypothetical protein ACJ735_12465 [Actinomycetes bacterium]
MSTAVAEPARTGALAAAASGRGRLIAVTADDRVSGLLLRTWGERCLVVPPDADWPARVRRSSTDVVLLDPRVNVAGLRFRDLSGAAHVAVLRTRARPAGIVRIRRDLARGRLQACGQVNLADSAVRADLFSVVRQREPTARRWYSAADGPGGFLDRLTAAGAQFVVLRWYDDLPDLPPGEDLDLLVRDQDLPLVDAVLAERPGTEPCDVYSVSGLPGTDFQAMAYFPPRLAQRIVARAELLRGRFPVPNPHDAFLALAYHVAYHKGAASGLPVHRGDAPEQCRDHDYLTALARTATVAGIEPPRSLQELDAVLSEHGLRPSRDVLHRLAVINPWAAQLASRPTGDAVDGLAVFFIREQAVAAGAVDGIVARIAAEGFTVLHTSPLDCAARDRVATAVRGGNWERGPYPISGGPPAIVVVAVDVMPAPVDARRRQTWPALGNARLLVKREIRDEFNATRAASEQCNILHSSDNADEAVDYLKCALPRLARRLISRTEQLTAAFAPAPDCIRELTAHGRRARIELVAHDGDLQVRKRFRPGCERFAARERFVAEQLAPGSRQLLPLVSADADSVVLPYRENTLRFDRRHPRLLPLSVVHEAMAVAEYLFAQGVALIDFTPGNLIVTATGRVYVVDFEFLHRYADPPRGFRDSYDIAGPPPGFPGDLPVNAYGLGYRTAWQPYVGLSFDQLRRLPRWRQHLLRTQHRLSVSWPRLLGDGAGLQRRRAVRIAGRLVVRIRRLTTLSSRDPTETRGLDG